VKKLQRPKLDPFLVRKLTRRLTATNAEARWESTSVNYKKFKQSLTEELLRIQGGRCAYCGCRLFGEPHRDHIAPKSPHYKWTFWPMNLVLACSPCNVDFKKAYNPVLPGPPPSMVLRGYKAMNFSFVHPYLDDPLLHIKFIGHRLQILISITNSSDKGRETINLFDLTNVHRAKERAMHAVFSRDVDYLHGKWRRLAEQVALAPFPRKLVLSKFGH